jgi:hypothetical protein
MGWLNPKLWRNLRSGSAEASDQVAKAAIGSVVGATLGMYAGDGKITGAAPTNPGERDRFYREGKQPYAIKIGDTWYPYQRLEPLNQTLSQVASVVQAINSKDKTADQMAMQAVTDIGKNLFSQTYAQGINDVLQALSEPERYGTQWIERFAGSMAVPASAAMRTAAQVVDPVQRQPKGIAETIAANVPGLSQTVPPRLSAFGETLQREGTALNPYNPTTEKDTPLNHELNRLQYNVGFTGDSASGVPLNREQQARYQQKAGQLLKAVYERVIQSSAYQQLSDNKRVEMLDKLQAGVKSDVRDAILQQIVKQRLGQRQPVGVR